MKHGVRVADSDCTSARTIQYLETGELPPPDLVCEPDSKVFDAPLETKRMKRSVGQLL